MLGDITAADEIYIVTGRTGNQLEVKQLTWQQFDWLMSGLEIEQPKAFKPTE